MVVKWIDERQGVGIRTVGKLRKGAAKPGRGAGKNLQTWRFTSDNEAVMAAFVAAYGSDSPEEVRCYLPYKDVRSCWDYFYETWTAKGLAYRCDGENWIKWRLPSGVGFSREPKRCPVCADRSQKAPEGEHKLKGRLTIIVPELLSATAGMVLMETGDTYDVFDLNGSFRQIDEMRSDGRIGDMRGIPFILRRVARVRETLRGKQIIWGCELTPEAEWVQAQVLGSSILTIVDKETGEVTLHEHGGDGQVSGDPMAPQDADDEPEDDGPEDDEEFDSDSIPSSAEIQSHGYRFGDGGAPVADKPKAAVKKADLKDESAPAAKPTLTAKQIDLLGQMVKYYQQVYGTDLEIEVIWASTLGEGVTPETYTGTYAEALKAVSTYFESALVIELANGKEPNPLPVTDEDIELILENAGKSVPQKGLTLKKYIEQRKLQIAIEVANTLGEEIPF